MHPLLQRVRRTIRRHDLVPSGGRVIAAVSGGSDSVALLHLLLALQEAGDLVLTGLVHVNHQLRGTESGEDEVFCRRLAGELSQPIVVESSDVRGVARADRVSIEQAARRVRHEVFARAARAQRAAAVAVGHTRDDQAETVLLRLLRGAGPVGLAGMHPRSGLIVRPLLDIRRQELREYLIGLGAGFRDDASNADVAIPRNRVRHELLPLLQERFSPAIVDTLCREADIARQDADYFETTVREAEDRLRTRTADGLVLDLEALRTWPKAVARRVVRRAMEEVAPGRFVGFESVDAVLDLADAGSPQGRRLDLPGQRAERRDATVLLRPRRGRRALDPVSPTSFAYPLTVPGEVVLPEAACRISAHVGPPADGGAWPRSRAELAVVAAAGLAAPLTVRSRRPGDAFHPLGVGGRKKLQDFFVDHKVQRAARDRVPLVVDGRDRIVWVAGYAVGEEFRVTDPTEAVVTLKWTGLGGEV